MKKSFVFTAIALLTLALSACNNSASSNNSSTQSNNNSNENVQTEVWHDTNYRARKEIFIQKGENAAATDTTTGYATAVEDGYELISGYAVKIRENIQASFISEDKKPTAICSKILFDCERGMVYK